MRFSNKNENKNIVFENFLKIFDSEALEKLGRDTGFISRKGKLKAEDMVKLCVFWSGKRSYPTLEQMVDSLAETGTKITKQSLDWRFNQNAAKFLKAIAMKVLDCKLKQGMNMDWAGSFNRVLVWDSTVGMLFDKCSERFEGFGGGATSSAFKVFHCFDLLCGNILDLLLEQGTSSDSGFRLAGIKKNDFCLFDLGYFNIDNLKAVSSAEAFFLSRLKSNTVVKIQVDGELKRVGLLKEIRKMKVGEFSDTRVFIGERDNFPVRLIMEKLSPEIAAAKRKKLKGDKQNKRKKVSQERLEFCDVNAFITNVDEEKLPAETVRIVYSLRWQIEIVFKCWKSHFDLDKVPDVKPHRFECCFWGCLTRIILATKFFWHVKIEAWNTLSIEISELKAFSLLQQKTRIIQSVLLNRTKALEDFLDDLWYSLTKNARKDRKKGRVIPSDILMYAA